MRLRLALLLWLAFTGLSVQAENRFPRPEFDSSHQLPKATTPSARSAAMQYVDTGVLFVALALASYLALSRRSRRGIHLLTLFSILYFGFWRRGCICPVGATQNVTLAFFDKSYAVPLTVLAVFVLPLVFTLFFGRTFCAAVCPLGTIQDVVIWRPVRLPRWLNHTLGLVPFAYLGLAVLYAAAGSMFVVCRWDPFVGLYRLSGSALMLAIGGAFLVLGAFIARPYCRFLCPYGALLKAASWVSRRHLTITPDTCVDCRLCRESCPFDAIRWPSAEPAGLSRENEIRRFALFLAVLPLAVWLGAWGGLRLAPALAQAHPKIQLARLMTVQESGQPVEPTLEMDSYRETGRKVQDLFSAATGTEHRFRVGSGVFGGFVAAVIVLKLMSLSLRRRLTDHVPDRAECLSCARCFAYCPVDRRREKEAGEGLPREELKVGEAM